MSRLTCTKLPIILTYIIILLSGCSSNERVDTKEKGAGDVTQSSQTVKTPPVKDSAPTWDADVNAIPDAVPIPHNGAYKNAPYTVLGKTYYPKATATTYKETGIASWYGTKFHGQRTANGELYDLYGMTAAHRTLPLPSYVKVTNLNNGRSVVVRVNDRGPFHSNRIIDLSFAAAKKLGYANIGTAQVKVEGIDPIAWWKKQGMKVPSSTQEAQLAIADKQASTQESKKEHKLTIDQPTTSTNNVSLIPGIYLQVGAFTNPTAAELLKRELIELTTNPVFISSIVQGKQTFYRVRLGPISDQDQALYTQKAIRTANLGHATLVTLD